jgi:hypothetical protein
LAQFRPSQFRRFQADIVSKNGSPPHRGWLFVISDFHDAKLAALTSGYPYETVTQDIWIQKTRSLIEEKQK